MFAVPSRSNTQRCVSVREKPMDPFGTSLSFTQVHIHTAAARLAAASAQTKVSCWIVSTLPPHLQPTSYVYIWLYIVIFFSSRFWYIWYIFDILHLISPFIVTVSLWWSASVISTEIIFVIEPSRPLDWRPHTHHNHCTITQLTLTGGKEKSECRSKGRTENLLPQLASLLFSHLSRWIRRLSLAKLPICCIFTSSVRSSGVGLSGADKQLVPAHHPLPHVHLVQPDVGLPYQGLLHELASVGYQEKLESH